MLNLRIWDLLVNIFSIFFKSFKSIKSIEIKRGNYLHRFEIQRGKLFKGGNCSREGTI
jgi:hypothetical protein